MTEIVLENLSKHFDGVKAVDNINLKIKNGEFLVLLGPSGCGKTTTLRLIAGLEKQTYGNIYFDGTVINDQEPIKRGAAMVFQDYALYPHMTVFDNIALCLKVSKLPKGEIIKRVKETAELLKIEELLYRKPGQLSGGQQQRVALGRAIARNPRVCLMDEPLSNLDAILRADMRVELKKLHTELKTTTVYVTHDQVEAMTMADRIAMLKNGGLLQVDTSKEMYSHPQSLSVAEFVGTPRINFIESSLLEKNGRIFLDAGDFRFTVSNNLSWIKEKASSSELIIGIRPEDVLVSTKRKKDFIEAKISLFQQLGNVGHVYLKIGATTLIAVVKPDFKIGISEKVFVRLDENRIHIFDKLNGKTLIS